MEIVFPSSNGYATIEIMPYKIVLLNFSFLFQNQTTKLYFSKIPPRQFIILIIFLARLDHIRVETEGKVHCITSPVFFFFNNEDWRQPLLKEVLNKISAWSFCLTSEKIQCLMRVGNLDGGTRTTPKSSLNNISP